MNMSLNDWYGNRQVLLTGVTSDVGRALLEKILRSFPDVQVFAALRTRGHSNKDDRIKKIFLSPRFERLRQEQPDAISRVKAIECNFVYDDLGMNKADKASLRQVSVAFHAAGPHDAVFEFCQELPELKVLVAVSSIFKHKGQIKESLQNEHVPDGPVSLVRIPFVGPAYREPMPGFVEILKGPTALMVGAGLALGRSEFQAQVIPIDYVVNTLIVVAWTRAIEKDVKGPVVYNAASIDCTWKELVEKSRLGSRKFPYPTFGIRGMTSMVTLHWILVLLFEWLPSILCDTILEIFGVKQRILPEYERVRNALRSLESISSRPWSAERNRVYLLQEHLTLEEQDAFPVTTEIDIESYALCAAAAARKYCADESNIRLVKIFRRLFFLLIAAALFYVFFYKYYLPANRRAESLRV